MKILAIDTSSVACSIALLIDDTIFSHHEIAPLQQAQIILPSINMLLNSHHVKLEELNAIAFGCGPGSFTGVRIATSIAQGLGWGASVPLIPISSLAALAQAAYEDLGWDKQLVAIDAKMNEIYCGKYLIVNGLAELQGQESVCSIDQFLFPNTEGWYGVGDAWDIYKSHLTINLIQVDTKRIATAKGIISLAKAKFQQGEFKRPSEAQPVYLREKVTS